MSQRTTYHSVLALPLALHQSFSDAHYPNATAQSADHGPRSSTRQIGLAELVGIELDTSPENTRQAFVDKTCRECHHPHSLNNRDQMHSPSASTSNPSVPLDLLGNETRNSLSQFDDASEDSLVNEILECNGYYHHLGLEEVRDHLSRPVIESERREISEAAPTPMPIAKVTPTAQSLPTPSGSSPNVLCNSTNLFTFSAAIPSSSKLPPAPSPTSPEHQIITVTSENPKDGEERRPAKRRKIERTQNTTTIVTESSHQHPQADAAPELPNEVNHLTPHARDPRRLYPQPPSPALLCPIMRKVGKRRVRCGEVLDRLDSAEGHFVKVHNVPCKAPVEIWREDIVPLGRLSPEDVGQCDATCFGGACS
ncbi:hypothetical protein CVT24_000818 [Panaeolus cyanescens]|uniref:Uncharacterized protein n=1 Tax=Panaeolus cyanescens TaxID=181874 RepID=A0A409YCV9_9AGAR|nr:hypothetical protein CVT24_000818 [Panaeolus cyanescens]